MKERWIQTLLLPLVASLLLQLVAFVTPWWRFYKEKHTMYRITEWFNNSSTVWTETKTSMGLLYFVVCRDETCITDTVVSIDAFYQGSVLYSYVSQLVKVLVAIVITALVATVKIVLVAKRRKWTQFITAICMMLLAIANTLQWPIISGAANWSVSKTEDPNDTTVYFPWSVFMFGLGALLVTCVLLCLVVVFVVTHFWSTPPTLHDTELVPIGSHALNTRGPNRHMAHLGRTTW